MNNFLLQIEEDIKHIHNKLSFMYESRDAFNEIYNEFRNITEEYARDYMEQNGAKNIEYATMTKSEINEALINKEIDRQERSNGHRSPYFSKYISQQ